MGKSKSKKTAVDASSLGTSAILVEESLFTSSIVQVLVGPSSKPFNVHKHIFSGSSMFLSKICETPDGASVTESKTSVPAFNFALQFLYGRPFSELKHRLVLINEPGTTDANPSTQACEVLCFALKYELTELVDALVSYFQETRDVSYRLMLTATKHLYDHAPKVEPWFKSFVQERTQDALSAEPNLVDEAWFVGVFERGHRGLSRHLFECYRNWCRFLYRDTLTPTSERNKTAGSEKHVEDAPTLESLSSPGRPRAPVDSNNHPTMEATANIPQIFDSSAELESFSVTQLEPTTEKVPWDYGLNAKERRRKQKAMQLAGTWTERVNQEMLENEKVRRETFPITKFEDLELDHVSASNLLDQFISSQLPEAALEPGPQPEIVPLPDPGSIEEMRPWDLGLSQKEKKRKQKQMKLHGIWDSRVTRDMIEEDAAAAAATAIHLGSAEVVSEAPAASESRSVLEPDFDAKQDSPGEEFSGWNSDRWKDYLTKLQTESTSIPTPGHGTVLQEEMIDNDAWAPKKKKPKKKKPHAATEPVANLESHEELGKVEERRKESALPSEAESRPVFIFGLDSGSSQEQQPWDFGLSLEELISKKREMKLNGTWGARLTQAMIDEQTDVTTTAISEQAGIELKTRLEGQPDSNGESEIWTFQHLHPYRPEASDELTDTIIPTFVPQDEEVMDEGWTFPKVIPTKKKRDKKKPRRTPESKVEPVASNEHIPSL